MSVSGALCFAVSGSKANFATLTDHLTSDMHTINAANSDKLLTVI